VAAADAQIMLALFQGEAYDLMGSQRFVDDVRTGCRGFRNNVTVSCLYPPTFTVAFDALTADPFKSTIIVEKILTGDGVKVLNADDGTGDAAPLSALLIATSDAQSGGNVTFTSSGVAPPATSTAQTFAKRTTALPRRAVLVSGTDSTFEPTHSSRLDRFDGTAEELSAVAARLGEISAIVAQSLLKEAGIAAADTLTATPDAAVMLRLAECLLVSMVCDTAAATLGLTKDQLERDVARQAVSRVINIEEPVPLFAGVYKMFAAEAGVNKLVERFARAFMSIKMSPPIAGLAEKDQVECIKDRTCVDLKCDALLPGAQNTTFACVAGKCTCSTAQFHDAFSLGIEQVKDEDNKKYRTMVVVDGEGKAWTEPVWSKPDVFVLQTGSAVTPVAMLLAGVVLTGISVVVVNKLLASRDPKMKVL
jgi:hypothetical protein